MEGKPTFSLIVATFGRVGELDRFLASIERQTLDLSEVEVIIVDQNSEINLVPILRKYAGKLCIHHQRSNRMGLSYNRNLGLRLAKGQIVAFPDDDCLYYPDTLARVKTFFEENPGVNLLLGRIVDRKIQKNSIRNWPLNRKRVLKINFLTLYSSITIFCKNPLPFDENMGVGTYYGSYEDADFVYRLISRDGFAIYEPSIEVWHEDQNIRLFSEEKVYRYGLGFGALSRKHLSLVMVYWLSGVLLYHTLGLFKALLRMDRLEARKRWLSIASRVHGFLQYPTVSKDSR